MVELWMLPLHDHRTFSFLFKVWKSVTILHRVGHLVTQQTSSYNWGIILILWLKDKDIHKGRPLKDLQHSHTCTHK